MVDERLCMMQQNCEEESADSARTQGLEAWNAKSIYIT